MSNSTTRDSRAVSGSRRSNRKRSPPSTSNTTKSDVNSGKNRDRTVNETHKKVSKKGNWGTLSHITIQPAKTWELQYARTTFGSRAPCHIIYTNAAIRDPKALEEDEVKPVHFTIELRRPRDEAVASPKKKKYQPFLTCHARVTIGAKRIEQGQSTLLNNSETIRIGSQEFLFSRSLPLKKIEGNGRNITLMQPIASGTFATIYEGFDLFKQVSSAVKVVEKERLKKIYPELSNDETKLNETLLKEATLLARLSHECIPEFHATHMSTKKFYLAMDWVPGRTLDQVIMDTTDHCLREDEVKRISRGLFSALKQVHDCGYTHLDVNPKNIILREQPAHLGSSAIPHHKPYLVDFGLARKTGEIDTSCGTPRFQAPEMLELLEGKPRTNKADMWSMGATIYYSFAGKAPYQDLAQIKEGTLDFTSSPVWSKVSDEAKLLIRRLLSYDSEARPDSTQVLQDPWLVELESPPMLPATAATPSEATTTTPATDEASTTFKPQTSAANTTAVTSSSSKSKSSDPDQFAPHSPLLEPAQIAADSGVCGPDPGEFAKAPQQKRSRVGAPGASSKPQTPVREAAPPSSNSVNDGDFHSESGIDSEAKLPQVVCDLSPSGTIVAATSPTHTTNGSGGVVVEVARRHSCEPLCEYKADSHTLDSNEDGNDSDDKHYKEHENDNEDEESQQHISEGTSGRSIIESASVTPATRGGDPDTLNDEEETLGDDSTSSTQGAEPPEVVRLGSFEELCVGTCSDVLVRIILLVYTVDPATTERIPEKVYAVDRLGAEAFFTPAPGTEQFVMTEMILGELHWISGVSTGVSTRVRSNSYQFSARRCILLITETEPPAVFGTEIAFEVLPAETLLQIDKDSRKAEHPQTVIGDALVCIMKQEKGNTYTAAFPGTTTPCALKVFVAQHCLEALGLRNLNPGDIVLLKHAQLGLKAQIGRSFAQDEIFMALPDTGCLFLESSEEFWPRRCHQVVKKLKAWIREQQEGHSKTSSSRDGGIGGGRPKTRNTNTSSAKRS
ncbi:CAMK protein kinase [Pelomyxa schiedti]|nr:CAMK protein kinase [Pelomyxa schiedti]